MLKTLFSLQGIWKPACSLLICACPPLQLSVEDNELASLAGLEPLVCLMELYAGAGSDAGQSHSSLLSAIQV